MIIWTSGKPKQLWKYYL